MDKVRLKVGVGVSDEYAECRDGHSQKKAGTQIDVSFDCCHFMTFKLEEPIIPIIPCQCKLMKKVSAHFGFDNSAISS